MTEATHETGLKKVLSPWQVWALALGSIIGWGCFVLPADSFLPGSGPLGTVIGMAVGALLLCTVAFVYGDMIEHAPVAGGEFAHAYMGFGPSMAFVCGWALVLGYISIIGANVSALSLLARYLVPGVFDFGELYTLAGWKVCAGEVMLMVAAIAVFGYVNYRGVSIAGSLQVLLAVILSAGVLLLAAGTFSVEGASAVNLNPLFSSQRSAAASITAIVAIAPWAFVGFDTVSQSAEEFSFSPRKARPIMFFAIFWGAFLYCLVTLSVAIVMPYPEMLANMEKLRAAGMPSWATGVACEMAFGRSGAVILALAMLAAVCTGIMGFYVATTRLMFSMGRGRMLPAWFAEIHPRYGTPYKAIIFTSIVVLAVPWCGRAVLLWIVDMSSVGIGIAYLFTCLAGLRVYLRHGRGRARIAVSLAGSAVSVACILLLLTPGSPAFISVEARWALLGWVALGTAFYLVNRRAWTGRPDSEARRQVLGSEFAEVYF